MGEHERYKSLDPWVYGNVPGPCIWTSNHDHALHGYKNRSLRSTLTLMSFISNSEHT
jgi:hypothetical protein